MTTVKTPAGDVSHNMTVEDVRALYKTIRDRLATAEPPATVGPKFAGRSALVEPELSRCAMQGLKAEIKAALNVACPAPDPDAVTDAHRIQSDKDRAKDPYHSDAHHWIQKKHSMALWAETERLIAAAGIVGGA